MTRHGRAVALDLGWSALLTALFLGPLLAGTGYWLVGDMVFVPQQPWKPAWLGLDGTLPRAVPMDALVSGLTTVLPGWLVQRLLLVSALLVGGACTGRLLAGHGAPARAAAIALVLWNPWLLERMLMGQWAIAAGALLLPATVLGALRVGRGAPAGWSTLTLALVGSAACSPSSGLMALAAALVVGATTPRRGIAVAVLGVAANLTWALPAVTATSNRISVDGVFDLFAARAESSAGLAASLLSLGGTWKSAVVPSARADALLVLISCLLSLVALVGLRHARLPGTQGRARLAVLGAGAFLLALLPALPGGARLLGSVGELVPAAAMLRDSHRFLAPLVVVLSVGLAGAVERLLTRDVRGAGPPRPSSRWLAGVLVLAPGLLLPQQAWGGGGSLEPVEYPDDWEVVVEEVRRLGPTRTVVLPWSGSYRGFDWNDRRAVLDPAPRLLPHEVVVDDRTFVEGTVIASEDPVVAAVDEVWSGARADWSPTTVQARLGDLGIGLVLVETPGQLGESDEELVAVLRAAGAVEVARATELVLLDVDPGVPVAATPRASGLRGSGAAREVVVLVGHAVTAGLVLGAAVGRLRSRRRAASPQGDGDLDDSGTSRV